MQFSNKDIQLFNEAGIDVENKNYTKSELEFSVTELRVCFDCEKKYKLFADFKRKVIDIAVREINEKSDIWVRPTYQKTG